MNAILLTRHSDFQKYCANHLWLRGLITGVITEAGYSFESGSGLRAAADLVWRNLGTLVSVVASHPTSLLDYVRLQRRKDIYLGQQVMQNHRVLGSGYENFVEGLPVVQVDDINSTAATSAIRRFAPKIVLVFGTRLIKPDVFDGRPFVNMHWGWSPDYRGEGIVSALALEGPQALGVTVHCLSARPDAGDILYQARPTVDAEDNFYSVGLKLTMLGTELFARVLEDFRRDGELTGRPQDLSRGQVFGTKYMKAHPHLYHEAWRRLRA